MTLYKKFKAWILCILYLQHPLAGGCIGGGSTANPDSHGVQYFTVPVVAYAFDAGSGIKEMEFYRSVTTGAFAVDLCGVDFNHAGAHPPFCFFRQFFAPYSRFFTILQQPIPNMNHIFTSAQDSVIAWWIR